MNYGLATFVFFLGVYVGVKLTSMAEKASSDRYRQKVDELFIRILNSSHLLEFTKRINNFVYLSFNNWTIIYRVDKKEISIFHNDDCIGISSHANKRIKNQIMACIEDGFFDEINVDVININGNIMSRDAVINNSQEIFENLSLKKEYNIDDILDKILERGSESLTKEEKTYLDNYYNSR